MSIYSQVKTQKDFLLNGINQNQNHSLSDLESKLKITLKSDRQ